jgi:hypothetical protein
VGGLTVLRALQAHLPRESFVYLGDTARLPYGTKSRESVERYALQAAALLVRHDIKCLVVACNTASAIALDSLRAHFAPLPVIGVVEPGAQAGVNATRTGRIAVIATESTVRGLSIVCCVGGGRVNVGSNRRSHCASLSRFNVRRFRVGAGYAGARMHALPGIDGVAARGRRRIGVHRGLGYNDGTTIARRLA